MNEELVLWKFLKKCALKIPWILLSLQLFNLLGRHLVMLSSLETGDSWRKLIGWCCIWARFPNTTSHPIPDTPTARRVEQCVPKAVVTRNLSLSVYILITRDFPVFSTLPWSESRNASNRWEVLLREWRDQSTVFQKAEVLKMVVLGCQVHTV